MPGPHSLQKKNDQSSVICNHRQQFAVLEGIFVSVRRTIVLWSMHHNRKAYITPAISDKGKGSHFSQDTPRLLLLTEFIIKEYKTTTSRQHFCIDLV